MNRLFRIFLNVLILIAGQVIAATELSITQIFDGDSTLTYKTILSSPTHDISYDVSKVQKSVDAPELVSGMKFKVSGLSSDQIKIECKISYVYVISDEGSELHLPDFLFKDFHQISADSKGYFQCLGGKISAPHLSAKEFLDAIQKASKLQSAEFPRWKNIWEKECKNNPISTSCSWNPRDFEFRLSIREKGSWKVHRHLKYTEYWH